MNELVRLREVEDEYRVTLKVLAVVIERLLSATNSRAVMVEPAALGEAPDLEARRDPDGRRIVLSVSR